MVKSTKKPKQCAAGPPPQEMKCLGRKLLPEDCGAVVDSRVSILSWNILAQRYVRSEFFPGTDRPLLKWKRRGADVVKSLAEFLVPSSDNTPVDLACLQEVDWFSEFYCPELKKILAEKKKHFGFCYKKRTGETSEKFDGSCVMFSKKRFVLIEEAHVEFNDLAKNENLFELKKSRNLARPTLDSKDVDYFFRDSVAAICVLEDQDLNKRFLVASAHLFWDPECTDVKILQAMLLLQNLNEIAERHDDLAGVFLGGDFNSTPDSAVVELLTTGRLPHDHPDVHNVPDNVVDYVNNQLENCKRIPSMLSAYTYSDGKQPGSRDLDVDEISTLTSKFSGNLDYIFYRDLQATDGEDGLRVSQVLSLPTVKSCHQDRVTSLPAFGHPSDHLPLLASLEFPADQR